ncbi:glycosyltransferase family 4 protein [Streptacidiphilus jiangxiensis]|uniref:Phosphatidylinositol alpha 1,6-mannosyltransferase n=1 Tax=Streptacidiphilus jiangxiensis TaxID=235985 RepID=A0A1H7UCQ8_STRJI|nr:glycosyltransferase family 1 protein [Streptacidiphilus jiangxiensis]SEL94485.1 phosphatidylinositol alpha 1,6-mannosyltransferase [Streptacidiphilus jiangxiensis]
MRVALVTESFPPDVNGVAHSVLRTAEHLVRRGHEPLVIAPAPAVPVGAADPCPVVRVSAMPLPGYPQVRIALPSRRLEQLIAGHRPDVVHLASPFLLGSRGMAAAERLGLPSVAVYQTDIAGYARAYRAGSALGEAAAWRRLRTVHCAADRTLAPSTPALQDLTAHGIPRVHLWRRGVDSARFHPRHRSEALRRELAPGGEVLVGYVGRLAPEKRVDLLAETVALPGVRVVVIGDGPSEHSLRQALPGALFLGRRTGDELAALYASLDVFAHTGPMETFCQTIQEAMASGVAVVGPALGGPLDLIGHHRTGLLVPARDGAALARAVAGLAADAPLRARYGAAGRAEVESRTWESVGDELIEHYRKVIAQRGRVGTETRPHAGALPVTAVPAEPGVSAAAAAAAAADAAAAA